jgi:PKD repeat protein
MKLSSLGWLLPTSLGMLVLLLSVQAQAGSTYLNTLNRLYNTAGTPLDNCGLCHTSFVDPSAGVNPGGLNPYGAAFKGNFGAIDGLPSDGDASRNGAEIRRGFFPGWDCSNYTKASGSLPANFMNLLDPDNIGCMSNLPPLASLERSYNGTVDMRVDFDASGSRDPDGTVVQYDWDFGDGVTVMNAGPLASHTYTAAGNYVVTLTVSDDAGTDATTTAMAYIVAVPVHPIADPGGPYDAIEGVALTLDGARSFDPDGGRIMSYFWDLGDGTMATGAAPNHVYLTGGNYTVTLVVSDDEGLASDPATTSVSIAGLRANLPPVSNPVGPDSANTGQLVSFDGSGSSDPDGTIVAYDWDFGDGNSGTGVSTSHSYQAAGTYSVTLTVTDDGGLTNSVTTTAVVADVFKQPAPVCDGIRVKAVWKSGERVHKYWHAKKYSMRHYRDHHDDDDEDDEGEDDEHEDTEDQDRDNDYTKYRYKQGKLIVFGRGQRGSKFILSNADDSNQIIGNKRGWRGRFAFRIKGERLSSVPCRVQVEQPDLQLCGKVDVINAPADCGVPAPGVLSGLAEDDEHERDDD